MPVQSPSNFLLECCLDSRIPRFPASSKDRLMNKSPDNHTLVQQLEEIKQHNEPAIAALWEQWYPALVKFAEKRLATLGVQQPALVDSQSHRGRHLWMIAVCQLRVLLGSGVFPDRSSKKSEWLPGT